MACQLKLLCRMQRLPVLRLCSTKLKRWTEPAIGVADAGFFMAAESWVLNFCQ
jgi:hypothetical protein